MSNISRDKSKTPTTIKIAAKDASQRGTGGTDPGPGDPGAMPSEMPEPVSIPAPPSPSELVVKSLKGPKSSVNSRAIKTINDPVSLSKSKTGSAMKSTASGMNPDAPREPTSSKALSSTKTTSKTTSGSQQGSSMHSQTGSKFSAKSVHSKSAGAIDASIKPTSQTGAAGSAGSQKAGTISGLGAVKTLDSVGTGEGPSAAADGSSPPLGQEQDLVEEGETEIEHPASPSPGAAPSTAASTPITGSPTSGGIDSAPISSGGGASKMSPKTSGHKSSKKSNVSSSHVSGTSGVSGVSGAGSKKKKKMTKFRYHKRITVRTHGKTSPTTVMDKVNMKDHKAGITPSSIGEMDPEELIKRAGIKGGSKAHWRVRLRQTKRTTKDGKTTTQTRVAYRDSEGNKRIKTSSTPDCQKCGKKLEDCKCDE